MCVSHKDNEKLICTVYYIYRMRGNQYDLPDGEEQELG